MKLERLHEYLLPGVATLGGVFLAAYCGKLSGAGQMSTLVVLLLGVVLMTVMLQMKERVWLLVPLFWGFAGRISLLPLPFSVSNLAVFFVFAAFLVFKALNVYRRKIEFDSLDLLTAANIVYLVTVFVRNPVGMLAFGSNRVGGRPYFEIFVAVLAYLILARVALKPSQSKTLPILMATGALLQGLIAGATYAFPSIVPLVAPIYSGIASDMYDTGNVSSTTGLERQSYLGAVATPTVLVLLSCYRPFTLINPTYFGRFLLFSGAILLVLLSGFRSLVFLTGVYFLLSSYLRQGWRDVINAVALGLSILVLVIALQGTLIELPFSAQRALSFLPGKWSEEAKSDAAYSTWWRVEMWKEMLASNKYIKDRVLGDGFGFSLQELSAIRNYKLFGGGLQQEEAMIVGGVHSGPISAIRFVGYVGLGLYLFWVGAMARRAWRLVKQARETPYFVTALFICMPVLYAPFEFVFVYGTPDAAIPAALFSLGLMKILKKTLEETGTPVVRENTRKSGDIIYKSVRASTLAPVRLHG